MSESQLDGDTEDQRQMDVADGRVEYAAWLRERLAALRAERQPWLARAELATSELQTARDQIERIERLLGELNADIGRAEGRART